MNDYESILEQIYELVDPFVVDGIEIKEDTDFIADLGFDSLKVMKLLEKVEDRFDISIPLNVLPDVRTIKDFADQLQKLAND
jgi:acyl carrier protein